jgi:hypothetical protein
MLWAKSNLIRSHAPRVACNALFLIGCINACFAQSEPPLTVPLAGRLPGPGCDAGLGGSSLYGNASPTANASPAANASAAGNASAGGNVGLGGITSHAGNAGLGGITSPAGNAGPGGNTSPDGNVPLYSNDNLYGNVPLYGTPDLGGNIPLYSNSSLYNNSTLSSNSSLGSYASLGSSASPGGNVPSSCRSAIPIEGWLLYPSIRVYSIYSDNLFLSPTAPIIKALGLGASPSLTAQWTNGIHTTTIYANFDSEIYPTDNTINTFNREATVTQKYAPLADLTFTVLGDYTHQTISSSLTNSIPNAISTLPSTPTRLSNGDVELPNGQIVSPSGQIAGQVNPVLANSGIALVNPYDQYTGTATVSKIFNNGILTLGSSLASTDYQSAQGTGPHLHHSQRKRLGRTAHFGSVQCSMLILMGHSPRALKTPAWMLIQTHIELSEALALANSGSSVAHYISDIRAQRSKAPEQPAATFTEERSRIIRHPLGRSPQQSTKQ